MILDETTASFGNGYLFTEVNENAPFIKQIGSMYIDFDEYPQYSGRISEIFEKNDKESIQYDHCYDYSSGE